MTATPTSIPNLTSMLTGLFQLNRPAVMAGAAAVVGWGIAQLPLPSGVKAVLSPVALAGVTALGGLLGAVAQRGTVPLTVSAGIDLGPIAASASIGRKGHSRDDD